MARGERRRKREDDVRSAERAAKAARSVCDSINDAAPMATGGDA